MSFAEMLTAFDDALYTWCLIYMLAGTGIYFTVRMRFVQLRLLKDCFTCMFEKKSTENGISSFQALMIATASRVGTGNMAGVATAIVGNYFYAEANILFISKNKTFLTIFRIAAAVMVMAGALNSMDVAWSLADITMGLEAVVNIIAIVLLSRIAFDTLKDYEKQKAQGIDPVFHERNIGIDNTDVWK